MLDGEFADTHSFGAVAFNPIGFDRSGFVRAHDTVADPTIRSYTGMVAALGSPSAEGKILSFVPAPVGPNNFPLSPDDLRGWRLTMLSGKRFGQVFTVSTNTASEFRVTAENGPIDGLDVRDVFTIESVDANSVSLFGPPDGANTVPSPGV